MSEKPVAERLQVKGQRRLAVLEAPKPVDSRIGVSNARATAEHADVVVLFTRNQEELDDKLAPLLRKLKEGVILWIAYPKLTSTLAADLNRDLLAKRVARLSLAPVAQIAIDEDWSALRFKLTREAA